MKLSDYLAVTEVGKDNVRVVMGGPNTRRVVVSTKLGMVEFSRVSVLYDKAFRLKTAFDKSPVTGVFESIEFLKSVFGNDFFDIKYQRAVLLKKDEMIILNLILRVDTTTYIHIRYFKE